MNYPKPVLTLVVVSYNHRPFIAQALHSAFTQTLQNFRVLVVDDASTDGSQSLVRELLGQEQWVADTIFHDVNRGVCATFNEALAAVDTPYVAFIAADDWMEPHRLATQVRMLDDAGPEFAVACSGAHIVDPEGRALPGILARPELADAPWGKREFFEALLEESLVWAPSAMIRTSALREIGGFDESLRFEDWDVWLRLARRGYLFSWTPEKLVFYRQHDSSLWSGLKGTPSYFLEEFKILSKHVGHSRQVDARLVPKLYHRSVSLYKTGLGSPALVPVMLAHARRTCDPRAAAFAALAFVRFPWARVANRLGGRPG